MRFAASASNTYSGTTTIASGELELAHNVGFTAILGALVIGQGVPPPNTARVTLLVSNQIANTANVTVRRDGTFAVNGLTEGINTLTVTDGVVTLGAAGDLALAGLSIRRRHHHHRRRIVVIHAVGRRDRDVERAQCSRPCRAAAARSR